MSRAITIICFFVFLTLSGCSIISHKSQLFTLKRISANRREAELYIKNQEKLFPLIVEDIKSNKLKPGLSKIDILSVYGEPVLRRGVPQGDQKIEEFLYRYPTRYFSSDRVYMYFDSTEKLVRWEYYPS